MTSASGHYERVGTILFGARELHGERLEAYLTEACNGDAALRAELNELLDLAAEEAAGGKLAEADLQRERRALDSVLDREVPAWLPESVGDYRILRQIGQGGMGVVYEAEQTSPRRRVAIKLLHPMHATPERLRRFRHEAELLGRLQHPGIARIFEAGTYDAGRGPQPFFAMELVEGVGLREHCERNALSREARMELLARVADAVQHAHDQGVIHRDLKPDNVLVDKHGQPHVLDFGIARTDGTAATLSTILTEEGQLVGTLAYMAPEQLRHAPDAVTGKVDVYALGVLAFELLVGRLPYSVERLSLSEAIAVLASTEPPRASVFDATLRGDLDTILGKALETEPARRYATPAALAAELRRHLEHLPIEARPPSRFYLVRKFARRNKALVGGVLATLAVALTGAAVSSNFALAATRRARELERASYVSGIAAASSAIQEKDYAAAAAYLERTPTTHRGFEHDYLRARLVQHSDEWTPPAPLVTTPAFDAAGRRLFALMSDGSLGTWDAASGRPLDVSRLDALRSSTSEAAGDVVVHGASGRFAAITANPDIAIGELASGARRSVLSGEGDESPLVHAWNADGRLLLYGAGATRIWDGERSRVLTPERFKFGAFTPDGARIALGKGGQVVLLDASSGDLLAERQLEDVVLDLAFAPDGETLAVAGYYRNAFLLDGRSLELNALLTGHRDSVYTVGWDPGGARLVTTSSDRTVRVWSADSAACLAVFDSGMQNTMRAAVTPDGTHLVVAGESIRRFPLSDPAVLRGHTSYVYDLAFSPDGSLLASAGFMDPKIHVWDVAGGRSLRRFPAPMLFRQGGRFLSSAIVAFSDEGERLVAGAHGGTDSWDVRTGAALPTSSNPDERERFRETLGRRFRWPSPRELGASADRVALDGGDGVVQIYDVRGADPSAPEVSAKLLDPDQAIGRLAGHLGQVLCAAFSPDGTRVATGGNDATVRLWDAETFEQLLVLRGHEQYVMDVEFSPDGSLLASASGDTTIRLWDTKRLVERRASSGGR